MLNFLNVSDGFEYLNLDYSIINENDDKLFKLSGNLSKINISEIFDILLIYIKPY